MSLSDIEAMQIGDILHLNNMLNINTDIIIIVANGKDGDLPVGT